MGVAYMDETQIERDLEAIAAVRNIAWQRNRETLQALIDRLSAKLIIDDVPRRQRRVYQSIIDLFEDAIERRFGKGPSPAHKPARRSAGACVRNFFKSLED